MPKRRRVPRWALPVVAVGVGLAVVAAGAVLAAGPRPERTAQAASTQSPSNAQAGSAAPSAATSSSASVGAAASPTPGRSTNVNPNPESAPKGWPGPANTGVQPGVRLKVDNTKFKTITTDGAVVENLDVTGNLEIDADNVTIRNVRVRCVNEPYGCFTLRKGHHGMRMDHVEVGGGANGTTMNRSAGGITIQRSDTRGGVGDNIIDHTSVHHVITGFVPDGFVTIRNSWVHDLDNYDGPEVHAGGVHFMSEGHTLMFHNRIEAGSTANIFIQQLDGVCESNITLDSNLIPGLTTYNHLGQTVRPTFGIQAYSCKPATIVARNNVFTKVKPNTYDAGPANEDLPWTAANWIGNKYLEDDTPVPIP